MSIEACGIINVSIDINAVLACKHASEQEAAYYWRESWISTASKTRYLFLGAIELIQLLFQTKGVRVSFFGTDSDSQDKLFVEDLLMRALGIEWYEANGQKVVVLARNHCYEKETLQVPKPVRDYEIRHPYEGKRCKELKKIVQEEESLEEAILIDSDPSHSFPGEEESLLFIPPPKSCPAGEINEEKKGEIIRDANRIFCLAGILFKAIEEAKNTNTTMKEILFRWQWKRVPDLQNTFEPNFNNNLFDNEEFYREGFERLRTMNPGLVPMTYERWFKSMTMPLPNEQRRLLSFYRKNEDSNLCILV